jgi:2,3,4,5-tetrahydropyridine-2-carboxylate N-succinyltransferase
MFVNAGAYVDEGTMIDSHALVGSCAQIGKRVHLSAAAQIGGVLEPAGAIPVIIEDDVMSAVTAACTKAPSCASAQVLATGTIITGSTPVFDLVREEVYRRTSERAAGNSRGRGGRSRAQGC